MNSGLKLKIKLKSFSVRPKGDANVAKGSPMLINPLINFRIREGDGDSGHGL